ncbi:zinc finger protein 354B-like [Topomyia yanbarensis]|uniref:zinc finger protein 354B-like n=1 Tax=Topomyia yanbarensis TaxID=2498891 RepID=UPI00273C119D|nr:zinc finger protein 354B-like [Topomyia yanbarensis]XP_058838200.1 zinc finger protein 354B-like [Topomyia yanbarensis]
MVRKCCVSDCNSNYDAVLRKGQSVISTFKFPDDPELRNRWIRAVKRGDNWKPGTTASVCINHFQPEDILKYGKPAKLKPNAVPTIFGLELNKIRTPIKRGRPRTTVVDPRTTKLDCAEHITEEYVAPVRNVLEELILDFESFNQRVDSEKLERWHHYRNNNILHFYNIIDDDVNDAIRIGNSIKVFQDMTISLFIGNLKQADEVLTWALGQELKISRWSQFDIILQKYDRKILNLREVNNGCDPQLESIQDTNENTIAYDDRNCDSLIIETIDYNRECSQTIQLEIEANLDSHENIEFLTIEDNDESTFIEDSVCKRNPLRISKQQALTLEERCERRTVHETIRDLKKARNKCFICSQEHESIEELEHHLPEHIAMLPYRCTECVSQEITLKTLASLNKHFLMHLKPLKCRTCDVRFSSYGTRLLHEQNSHEYNRPLTCDVCGKVLKSLRGYQYHIKIHTEPETMKCQICGKVLSSGYELKLHMRVHTKEKPNHCPFCDATFNRVSNLVEHKRRYHFKEKPFVCTVCDERFLSNAEHSRHILSHDPAAFKGSKKNRARRMNAVVNEKFTKDYQCLICGKRMSARVNYHSHMRKHRKQYQCSYCGLRIGQRRDFMDHENTHTGNRPYKCEICSKRFQTSSTYYGHRKVHSTEKRFACDVCDRRFSRLTHLTSHSRTHSAAGQEQRVTHRTSGNHCDVSQCKPVASNCTIMPAGDSMCTNMSAPEHATSLTKVKDCEKLLFEVQTSGS